MILPTSPQPPPGPLDPSEGALQCFVHDLRTLREQKGLAYRQLAAKAGYSRTTLSYAAQWSALEVRRGLT